MFSAATTQRANPANYPHNATSQMNQESLPTSVNDNDMRYREMRKVTLLGSVLDLALGIVKIVVGKLAFSQALIADGVHSLSDLVTDFLVIWAAKEANREPDADHPYGHQRIETVATIMLSLLLLGVAVAIGFNAVGGIFSDEVPETPTFWALVVAAISVVSKEAIYQYTVRAADRIGSELLRSNAWHSRTDALSSIVVIIGIGGSMAGFVYLDAVAALVVALIIMYIALKMIWLGVRELIDTGVDPQQLAAIRQSAMRIEGVSDIHDLRTRRMGSDVYLDGHVLVDPKLSVSEGHRIGDAVHASLKAEYTNLSDMTIHVDAEDDENYHYSSRLPLRRELISRLQGHWKEVPEAGTIDRIVLHYLSGQVQVEVWLPLDQFETTENAHDVAHALKAACADDEQIAQLEVLFH